MDSEKKTKHYVIQAAITIGCAIVVFWVTNMLANPKVTKPEMDEKFNEYNELVINPIRSDIQDLKNDQEKLRTETLDEIKGLRNDFKDLQKQIIDIIKDNNKK